MYYTLEDLANFFILSGKGKTTGQILKDIIDEWLESDDYEQMVDGDNYYKCDHDVLDSEFNQYTDKFGVTQTDQNKANNKLVFAAHRRMVFEKSGYLLQVPPNITHKDDGKSSSKSNAVNDILGDDFHDMLVDWSTGASNKGREWVHPYIDGKEFDLVIFDAKGVIPFYETSKQKYLDQAIRFYNIEIEGVPEDQPRYAAEWYYKDRVEYWQQDADGNFLLVETKGHIAIANNQDNTKKYTSWGRVPLVELQNNTYRINDLKPIKSLIDALDRSKSTFTNNLEDIQEIILAVVGFDGTEPSEVREQFRQYKTIVIQAGLDGMAQGSVDTIEANVPHEARKVETDDIIKAIYAYGMGLNPFQEDFGDASGVYLKWLYMAMDLKAGAQERKFKKALSQLMWFVTEYLKRNNLETIDPKGFQFTFTKTMIANVTEQIGNAQASKGIISDRTILKNHPWVEDVNEEEKALEEQREQYLITDEDDSEDDNETT